MDSFCARSCLGLYCSSVCTPWATAPARNLLWLCSPWVATPSQCVHLIQLGGPHGLQGRHLLPCGPPWVSVEQPVPPWPSPQATGSLCSGAWSTSSSSFLTSLVIIELFLTFSRSCLTAALLSYSSHLCRTFATKNFHINGTPHKKDTNVLYKLMYSSFQYLS